MVNEEKEITDLWSGWRHKSSTAGIWSDRFLFEMSVYKLQISGQIKLKQDFPTAQAGLGS